MGTCALCCAESRKTGKKNPLDDQISSLLAEAERCHNSVNLLQRKPVKLAQIPDPSVFKKLRQGKKNMTVYRT